MDTHFVWIILIAGALSLGIYGIVVQRGANLVRFDRRTALMVILWGVFEFLAVLAGYGIGKWILRVEMTREQSMFWIHIVAGAILVCIGIRMLIRAFQNHAILERRMENVDIRADVILALRMCVHSLFAGIACSLLQLSMLHMLLCVFAVTAVFAAAGYITGRFWGAAPSDKAFGIGGGLLCLIGILLQVVS